MCILFSNHAILYLKIQWNKDTRSKNWLKPSKKSQTSQSNNAAEDPIQKQSPQQAAHATILRVLPEYKPTISRRHHSPPQPEANKKLHAKKTQYAFILAYLESDKKKKQKKKSTYNHNIIIFLRTISQSQSLFLINFNTNYIVFWHKYKFGNN